MTNIESRRKTDLVHQARKLGAYARRIEDKFAVGVLDVVIAYDNAPVCFIEGKFVEHRAFGPTERQWVEGNRILALEGGYAVPLLVAWDEDGEFYISAWSRKTSIDSSYNEPGGTSYAEILQRYMRQRHEP